jgi:MOSC domain-containing protein YiiM
VGRLVSVNVGRPRILAANGGQVMMSAIVKAPVEGRVRAEGVNLTGDD